MRKQHGRYYGQKTLSNKTDSNVPLISETENTRRDFLNRKYEDDLRHVRSWRRFTLVVSAVGIAMIFLGVVGCIVISIIRSALIGGVAGGISTLAGLITNAFLHLVFKPAEKANERLEHACAIIVEEEQRNEDMQLLETLDEADRKEYIKQRLFYRIPSAELSPAKNANEKTGKPSRSQKPF